MTDRPNLAAALAALEQAAPEVDADEVPALVTRLAAVLAVAGARLAAQAPGTVRRQEQLPPSRYLTQTEAAAMFGIPLSAVRYLTRRGRVPAIGKGKNRRVLPADLAHYLDDCKRAGRSLRETVPSKKALTASMPMAYSRER